MAHKRHYRRRDPVAKLTGVSLPKLVKRLGIGAGAYLGAFGPSNNTIPSNAIEELKTNPRWAMNDLVASIFGYNGNSGQWSTSELSYFWGPVIATQILSRLL